VVIGFVYLLTWLERKQSAVMQDRIGANRASIFGLRALGLFHPIADALKMLTKEDFIPNQGNRLVHTLAPIIALFFALMSFAVVPFGGIYELGGHTVSLQILDLNVGLLYVLATMNLNGDYISDALAAQVGGIGIAPGANIGDRIALFEATHGTAPKYTGLDKVNPGSLVLSAEMMLRHLGWRTAADLILVGMEGAIQQKTVTYDFERLMSDATLLSCSAFGDAVIDAMN